MATGDKLGAVMQTDIGSSGSGGVAHQAVEPSLGAEFDATATYAVNDFVMKAGVLYRCTNAHTGAWDAADFSAADAGTYLAMVAAADAIASGGVAPGGFGLGGIDGARIPKIATRAALDTATRNGWYIYQSTEDIAGTVPYKYGAMLVIAYTQNRTMQMMYLYTGSLHNLTVVTRYQDGAGNWNAWEYLNPPTDVGNEYQTMERFLGKPVYALVTTVDVPADYTSWGSTLYPQLNGGYIAPDTIVSAEAYYTVNGAKAIVPNVERGATMSSESNGASFNVSTAGYINLRVGFGSHAKYTLAGATLTVYLKYTKPTI